MPQDALPFAGIAGYDPVTPVLIAPNITALTVTDALGYYQDTCELTFEVPLDEPANGFLNVSHVRELPRLMGMAPAVTGSVGNFTFGNYFVKAVGGTKRYDHMEITLGGNRFQATATTEARLRETLAGQLATWGRRWECSPARPPPIRPATSPTWSTNSATCPAWSIPSGGSGSRC